MFMSVHSYVSERCVSDFLRLALYLCMRNDQNRSTSALYLRSKLTDDWAASPLSSTTEEEACVYTGLMKKKYCTNVRTSVSMLNQMCMFVSNMGMCLYVVYKAKCAWVGVCV